jgi:hypothetical protein
VAYFFFLDFFFLALAFALALALGFAFGLAFFTGAAAGVGAVSGFSSDGVVGWVEVSETMLTTSVVERYSIFGIFYLMTYETGW